MELLSTCFSDQTSANWFVDHLIAVVDQPANLLELIPKESLWDVIKMRNTRPKNIDELKADVINQPRLQQHLSSATC